MVKQKASWRKSDQAFDVGSKLFCSLCAITTMAVAIHESFFDSR